jgi:hypothetical protein
MKTHWKKLTNPNYLGAYDFQQGEKRIVTIKEVIQEKVQGSDGKSDDCIVAHFTEGKPMILNVTNCKAIAKAHGTNYIEEWNGFSITDIRSIRKSNQSTARWKSHKRINHNEV